MTRHPVRPLARRAGGFTLVELLVVIGIIALLIGILLPTLSQARQAAKTAVDLSNQKQVATGIFMYANDRGVIPTISDDQAAKQADPSRTLYDYRTDQNGDIRVKDWVSSIITYLEGTDTTFEDGNGDEFEASGFFQCPSDEGLTQELGYIIPTNTDGRKSLVSYGLNADIAAVNVTAHGEKRAVFGQGGNYIGVYGSPNPYSGETYHGQGAGGKLVKVQNSASTLLLGDAGTIRSNPGAVSFNDRPDLLVYFTNYMAYNGNDARNWGTLAGLLETDWIKARIPLDRHDNGAKNAAFPPDGGNLPPQGEGGRVVVAFVDGHAEAVDRGGMQKVKITPFDLPAVQTNND